MPFHSGHGYYGTGDWLWSIFSTALFIVLVAVAIMLLVRLLTGGRRHATGAAVRPVGAPWFGPGPSGFGGPGGPGGPGGWERGPDAERILAERYARGEISDEEYRSRLEVLRQTGYAAGWARPEAGAQQPPMAPQQPPAAEQPTEEMR